MRRAGVSLTAGALCAALVAAPSAAAAQEPGASSVRVGARLGGSLNLLSQPTDPAGDATLLYGSGFVGPGFTVGLAAAWSPATTPLGPLDLELDVLYASRQGEGFAEDSSAGQRQTVVLRSQSLLVPLRVGLRAEVGPLTLRVAAGPQLVVGLGSGAEVTYEGIDAPAPALATASPTHVGASMLAGVSLPLGAVSIPLELRFDWDPMVPGSTQGRFDEVAAADAGAETYSAAFDYAGVLMLGIDLAI